MKIRKNFCINKIILILLIIVVSLFSVIIASRLYSNSTYSNRLCSEDNESNILLTNDDGINSEGLYALYQELSKIGQVTVVVPKENRSGISHAITLANILRVEKVYRDGKLYGYALNGTPADCVRIAVKEILKKHIDLVISGINIGENVGFTVNYSGTVGAAKEASILGIPAIAVSAPISKEEPNYNYAVKFIKNLSLLIVKNDLPKGTALNVNLPLVSEEEIKGVVITRQSKAGIDIEYEKRIDPQGKDYFWPRVGFVEVKNKEEDSDYLALNKQMVSITPIHFDLTDYDFLSEIKKWNIK